MSTKHSKVPNRMQRCVVITAAGGPEVLQMQARQIPQPVAGEVLIRVKAAGINRHDCNQRGRGTNPVQSDIPGLEVAGVVEAVGEDAGGVEPGMAVCALVDGGGYAEYAIASSALVFPVPDAIDMAGAASLPEAAFTAWYNLFSVAGLKQGESVLIHGGTSGVGVFAIQMLRALGHPVYATCGSDAKCAAAEALGASLAVNYRTQAFDAAVTGRIGREIDVVLDMSAGVHMQANLEALAYRGRIVHLSSGAGAALHTPLALIMKKEARITGSLMRPLPLPEKAAVARMLKTAVWPHIGAAIKPQVAHVLPLNEAAEAHRLMEQGNHIGKIVLRVA
jgi:NADPH2:quinone reductase